MFNQICSLVTWDWDLHQAHTSAEEKQLWTKAGDFNATFPGRWKETEPWSLPFHVQQAFEQTQHPAYQRLLLKLNRTRFPTRDTAHLPIAPTILVFVWESHPKFCQTVFGMLKDPTKSGLTLTRMICLFSLPHQGVIYSAGKTSFQFHAHNLNNFFYSQ